MNATLTTAPTAPALTDQPTPAETAAGVEVTVSYELHAHTGPTDFACIDAYGWRDWDTAHQIALRLIGRTIIDAYLALSADGTSDYEFSDIDPSFSAGGAPCVQSDGPNDSIITTVEVRRVRQSTPFEDEAILATTRVRARVAEAA